MYSIGPYGDSAILINLDQIIDETINEKAIAIARSIEEKNITGLTFIIPAYCSITVGYNPLEIGYELLKTKVEESCKNSNPDKLVSKKWKIPVCYDLDFALDMEDVTVLTGLSKNEIIEAHTGIEYRVYMLGFLPGFAYMGKTVEQLYCNRKATPRKKVSERSVGLAGNQTGIYPVDAPGGWQIIGSTPIDIFNKVKERPFLFSPGDKVKFYPVSKSEYRNIRESIHTKSFNEHTKYG
jgi:inhibitor of KinA